VIVRADEGEVVNWTTAQIAPSVINHAKTLTSENALGHLRWEQIRRGTIVHD